MSRDQITKNPRGRKRETVPVPVKENTKAEGEKKQHRKFPGELEQISFLIFQRIFSLSKGCVLDLINSLCGTRYEPDIHLVALPARDFTHPTLGCESRNVVLQINDRDVYYISAQMVYEEDLVGGSFDAEYYEGLKPGRNSSLDFTFPEPIFFYLAQQKKVPAESFFSAKRSRGKAASYRAYNFACLHDSIPELARKKLYGLIPFQILCLCPLLFDESGKARKTKKEEFLQAKQSIFADVINILEKSFNAKNITSEDAEDLYWFTRELYIQILFEYNKLGKTAFLDSLPPEDRTLPERNLMNRLYSLEERTARLTQLKDVWEISANNMERDLDKVKSILSSYLKDLKKL